MGPLTVPACNFPGAVNGPVQVPVLLGVMPSTERHQIRRMIGPAPGQGLDVMNLITMLTTLPTAVTIALKNNLLQDFPVRGQ